VGCRERPRLRPVVLLLASPHALYHDAALLLAVPATFGLTRRGLWVAALVGALHRIGVLSVGVWPVLSALSVAVIAVALLRDEAPASAVLNHQSAIRKSPINRQ